MTRTQIPKTRGERPFKDWGCEEKGRGFQEGWAMWLAHLDLLSGANGEVKHASILRQEVYCKAPILWPPDAKNQLIGKDPDAGKDQRWGEKERTEDEMVGWHHWLDGHEFE